MGLVRSAGARWVSVGAVVVLGVSGCAGPGSGEAASPSPSSTGIPEDVKVCGFLKPSEAEGALGFTIARVMYEHSPGSLGELDSSTASLFCDITSTSGTEDPHVNVWYEPAGVIDEVISVAPSEPTPVFDDAKALESAEEFSIEGVEGEGLTLIDERRSIAMWHYPDDHVLIVEMQFIGAVESVDRRPQAKALLESAVTRVVEQASKPKQELTWYPSDLEMTGLEYHTPNAEPSVR